MILEMLLNCARLERLHPGFPKAFEFLQQESTTALAEGRYEIEGKRIFAIVSKSQGRGRNASPLEFHRRYIDIQFVMSGREEMGWLPLSVDQRNRTAFDVENDIGFPADQPREWFSILAGELAILFPDDGHAPLAGAGEVQKVVVKVAI